jgi:hypothetical protein
MARPSAETVISKELDYYHMDIMESEGYWIITYQNKPVGLRHRFYTIEGVKMKYPRTGFNNQAHCVRLAARLNKHFGTDEFDCQNVA